MKKVLSNILKLLFMAVFVPLHFVLHLSMFPISIVVFLIQDLYKAVDGRSYREIIVTYLNELE